MPSYRALVIGGEGGGARLTVRPQAPLRAGQVEVAVRFCGLARGDTWLLAGCLPPPARPLVPGLDLAGEVARSASPLWREGDRVVALGHGPGRMRDGGLAERARLPAERLAPLPEGFSAFEVAALGTAGLCAMLSLLALEGAGVVPEAGPVLVTGATGGLGSLAVLALRGAGYEVTAATGRAAEAGYLRALGAGEVLVLPPGGALPAPETPWAGAVDCLGGALLGRLPAHLARYGVVAACGDVAGRMAPLDLDLLVPRGVAVIGIDAHQAGRRRAREAWERWSDCLDAGALGRVATVSGLGEAAEVARAFAARRRRGRHVVLVAGQARVGWPGGRPGALPN